MRYAILGDIHSNLTALETVLAEIEACDVDAILSVGDIVGYGAAPSQAIQLVRELGVTAVKGNHDSAVAGELDTRLFNPFARLAAEWTTEVLSEEELQWLRELPLVTHLEHCTVAHGTLAHPERFDYVQSIEDADPSLDEMTSGVCFVGHTHVPVSIMRLADDPQRTAYTIDTELDLGEIGRALINVGSVGQPRDEDPRTSWALFDSSSQQYTLNRVEYEVDREARRIRDAGLPEILADRLFLGV